MSYKKEEFDKCLNYIKDNPNYKLGFDLALGIYEFNVYAIEQELIKLNYATYQNDGYQITETGKKYLLTLSQA